MAEEEADWPGLVQEQPRVALASKVLFVGSGNEINLWHGRVAHLEKWCLFFGST
jgi:hypothetical protein